MPPRWLHPPHHGKEQSCLRLLALPGNDTSSRQLAAVCCITGGEDALLRQQLLQLPPPATQGYNSSSGGAFSAAALLAEQTQGTAVKALDLLPLHPFGQQQGQQQEWLLVSAGAKQSLIACRLRPQQPQHHGCDAHQLQERQQLEQPQEEQRQEQRQRQLLPLVCDELAVKEPAVELRSKKPVPGVSFCISFAPQLLLLCLPLLEPPLPPLLLKLHRVLWSTGVVPPVWRGSETLSCLRLFCLLCFCAEQPGRE
jgi:hypothetical protein